MVDIDVNYLSEAINDKADRDINNLTDSGYAKGSGLGMPSGRYIDLTVGADGTTYTAPANGYFCVSANTTAANGRVILTNNTGFARKNVNPISGNNGVNTDIPCIKGNVISLQYVSVTFSYFRFYYADGEPTQE